MARKIEPKTGSEPPAIGELRSRHFVSITELKKNPMRVFVEAKGETFAVLNFNRPEFYIVPAAAYAAMLDRIEDFEDAGRAEPGLKPAPA